MRPRRPLVLRLVDKIDRDPGEVVVRDLGPCWPWIGARTGQGYGVVRDGSGRLAYAHRVALATALGRPIAAGMVVRHRCDYPRCVRPAHLVEGTVADNVEDMKARGRYRGIVPLPAVPA